MRAPDAARNLSRQRLQQTRAFARGHDQINRRLLEQRFGQRRGIGRPSDRRGLGRGRGCRRGRLGGVALGRPGQAGSITERRFEVTPASPCSGDGLDRVSKGRGISVDPGAAEGLDPLPDHPGEDTPIVFSLHDLGRSLVFVVMGRSGFRDPSAGLRLNLERGCHPLLPGRNVVAKVDTGQFDQGGQDLVVAVLDLHQPSLGVRPPTKPPQAASAPD